MTEDWIDHIAEEEHVHENTLKANNEASLNKSRFLDV